MFAAVFIFWVV